MFPCLSQSNFHKWTLDNFRIWIKFLHFPHNNLPNCGPCFPYLLWSYYLSLITPAGSHYLSPSIPAWSHYVSLAITHWCGLRTAPFCSRGLCIMWLLLCVPWFSCLASMSYLLEFGYWLFSVPQRSIHKSLTSSVVWLGGGTWGWSWIFGRMFSKMTVGPWLWSLSCEVSSLPRHMPLLCCADLSKAQRNSQLIMDRNLESREPI